MRAIKKYADGGKRKKKRQAKRQGRVNNRFIKDAAIDRGISEYQTKQEDAEIKDLVDEWMASNEYAHSPEGAAERAERAERTARRQGRYDRQDARDAARLEEQAQKQLEWMVRLGKDPSNMSQQQLALDRYDRRARRFAGAGLLGMSGLMKAMFKPTNRGGN